MKLSVGSVGQTWLLVLWLCHSHYERLQSRAIACETTDRLEEETAPVRRVDWGAMREKLKERRGGTGVSI
jgi:hypothetical protein